jgi:predicted PhzF superfamily epimerase YddE/YHI9
MRNDVDAFAEAPFTGNPAAAGLMEKAAAVMNLSETAFVVPEESGGRAIL